ncbi:unnamed protein product [Microthlaspi erraticum]|uniref:Uncharacterized protein n=1 Tax=Microthlaspi erraticum TaxID=1685480 RepID=A0A6D2JDC4_9BRAS|nr:unnamed protein product [Microthlaspi erraticum]
MAVKEPSSTPSLASVICLSLAYSNTLSSYNVQVFIETVVVHEIVVVRRNRRCSQTSKLTFSISLKQRHKSKNEVMAEIIMKSKLGKMEKTKKTEERARLMDELDKDFKSLENSHAMARLTQEFDLLEVFKNEMVQH